jgi:hypothetical protein
MTHYQQEVALLTILLATCERSLEAFQAAGNTLDDDFVSDLERIIARTRGELDTLSSRPGPGLREAGT